MVCSIEESLEWRVVFRGIPICRYQPLGGELFVAEPRFWNPVCPASVLFGAVCEPSREGPVSLDGCWGKRRGVLLLRVLGFVAAEPVDAGLVEVNQDHAAVRFDYDVSWLDIFMLDGGFPPDCRFGVNDILEDSETELFGG